MAMSVMFIDTCAMPYSSMNQPIAFVAGSVPGCMTGLPAASFTTFTRDGVALAHGAPLAHVERNGVGAARGGGIEVEIHGDQEIARTDGRGTRAATPSSNGRAPEIGAVSLCASFGQRLVLPARQTARLRRSG